MTGLKMNPHLKLIILVVENLAGVLTATLMSHQGRGLDLDPTVHTGVILMILDIVTAHTVVPLEVIVAVGLVIDTIAADPHHEEVDEATATAVVLLLADQEVAHMVDREATAALVLDQEQGGAVVHAHLVLEGNLKGFSNLQSCLLL